MKAYKTPLRYPGGKSRAVQKLFAYICKDKTYTEFREPFLGGGSFAIEWTKRYPDTSVWVSDLYEPLVNFWQHIQTEGTRLRDELVQLKNRHPEPDSAKELFLQSKDYLATGDCNFDRAVSFYVINKCSFSGLTESSSFSKQASESNFSMRGIDRIPGFQDIIKNWRITKSDYETLLTNDQNTLIYLDPPYDIKANLYGKSGDMHKGFDHDRFAADCQRYDCDQLVSYNSSQLVCDRFKDWNASEFQHTYTMRSVGEYMREQQDRRELVLMNYA